MRTGENLELMTAFVAYSESAAKSLFRLNHKPARNAHAGALVNRAGAKAPRVHAPIGSTVSGFSEAVISFTQGVRIWSTNDNVID